MTKWEYRLIDLSVTKGDDIRELTAAGENGWEAVGMTMKFSGPTVHSGEMVTGRITHERMYVLMKRPKP